MADRGNCKYFAPNYFNPTKCQNCYKPKEHHVSTPVVEASASTKVPPQKKTSVSSRNAPPVKLLLKEGLLLRAVIGKDKKPQSWEKRLFALYSTGDLEEFPVDHGKIDKACPASTIRLQDFVRMLDGKDELGEDICFGLKSLKDTVYFKTMTKVDYENWWKEFSSFVAAPIKRTASTSSSLKSGSSGVFSKTLLGKQFSSPSAVFSSKSSTRSSRSSSVSSIQDDLEHPQLEVLRNQVAKLEEENAKLAKAESERRKMELEVNYWKEYVTNTQILKRSGGSVDAGKELSDARQKLIHVQDELNESQKKLKHASGKLLLQNKDLNDTKEKLHEANSIIAVHKAKIDQLTKEIVHLQQNQKPLYVQGEDSVLIIGEPAQAGGVEEVKADSKHDHVDQSDQSSTSSNTSATTGAHHLEDKFLVLKDRLKRIEKELFLKSKELEKANESRSKVAKYTRSLLQELESRLSDATSKLSAAEDKLANTSMELEMERERRKKLEESGDGPRRRTSSIVRPATGGIAMKIDTVTPLEFSEDDINSKYADYYRSRFKEVEASLMEKDIKLNGAEEKVKDLQNQLRNTSDNYKIIEDLQVKLSDATHKLSDRQLKIHELQRELETSKGFEKSYERISKEHDSTKQALAQSERLLGERSQKLQELRQELEMFKIREVVMKEQIQTYEENDATTDGDDTEEEVLQKSVEAKSRISSVIELEAQVKRLQSENSSLNELIRELESRRAASPVVGTESIGIQVGESFGSEILDLKQDRNKLLDEIKNDKIMISELQISVERGRVTASQLECKLSDMEDRLCRELTSLKEKHAVDMEKLYNDVSEEKLLNKKTKDELNAALVDKAKVEQSKQDVERELREAVEKLALAASKLNDFEEKFSSEASANMTTQVLLNERTRLLEELEARCKRLAVERDTLKEELSQRKVLRGVEGRASPIVSQFSPSLSLEAGRDAIKRTTSNQTVPCEDADDAASDEVFSTPAQSTSDDVEIPQKLGTNKSAAETMEEVMRSLRQQDALIESWGTEARSADVEPGPGAMKGVSEEIVLEKRETVLHAALSDEVLDDESYEAQYRELSKRFIASEEKVIELANALDRRLSDGDHGELSLRDVHLKIDKLDALEMRLSEIQMQLREAESPLLVKAEELERERKNVIHLVEVTSAYIKELENTVAQSKAKIEELQRLLELPGGRGSRQPPDGSSAGKELVRVASCEEDTDGKDEIDTAKSVRTKLSAKIMTLQSDISELKASHARELLELKEAHQILVESLRSQLSQAGISKHAEEMAARIEELENQLEKERRNYTSEVELLRERFQEELRAAFNGDAGGIDLLNRVHELEVELNAAHKDHALKIKEIQEAFEEEKEQMKDDLATVLQASLSANFAEQHYQSEDKPQSAVVEALEEKIIKLEQDLKAMEEKHVEEMEIEKETHQREMEDTIRDMLTVRETAALYSSEDSQEPGRRPENRHGSYGSTRTYTVEEVEEMRSSYDQQLAEKDEEHFAEMQQARQDFAIVIASIKAGNTSETILELTTRIKELEQELEECKTGFQLEIEDLSIKLKRADSANFFGLRRNEEMGSKIYQMQNDMEEMDRKHKLELEAYRESLKDGSNSKHLDELILENQCLENRKNELETELEMVRKKHLDEMEMYTIRLQEEKRASVEEMTDKVLKLEALIEEIKAEHKASIRAFEKQAREEKFEAVSKEREKCKELESKLESAKRYHEIEIQELRAGQKKEANKFYEKERVRPGDLVETKRRAASEVEGSIFSIRSGPRSNDVAELEERHAKEIKELKDSFALERQKMEENLQNQINDIRTQYDEKLKSSVKEGMRRQSFSDRKSDASRMRELVVSNESLRTKLLDLEIKYEDEVKNYKAAIKSSEKIIAELKGVGSKQSVSHTNSVFMDLPESQSVLAAEKLEEQKKLKEITDQIERYQRRIEYYKDKAERECSEESHRVEELQTEIVQLQKELKSFEKKDKPEADDHEKLAPRPAPRASLDRSAPRRHTDSFDGGERHTRLRDPRKRWSNLEERSEKDEIGKSGSVLARKVLWENISTEDVSAKPVSVSKAPLARTTSCMK